MIKLTQKQIDDFRKVSRNDQLGFTEAVYDLIGGAVITFKNGSGPIEVYSKIDKQSHHFTEYSVVVCDDYVYDYFSCNTPIKLISFLDGLLMYNKTLSINDINSFGDAEVLYHILALLDVLV